MRFSIKTKFKLNTSGGNSSNSCNQEMSPDHSEIVTYKPIGSKVSFLYYLCFIYQLVIKTSRISWYNNRKNNVTVMQ